MRSLAKIVFVALTACAAVASAGEKILVEGILIRVNDRIITVSDFAERVRTEFSQIPEPPSEAEARQFVEMLLQEVVNELVLMERATEKRLTVEEGMVDQAIANLREENNLLEDEAWEQAVASSGLTVEALRERYRRNILLQRAVQGEVRPVEITMEELRRDYEQTKEQFRIPAKVELEQVFLTAEGSTDAELMNRARGLVGRVREGADLRAEATLAGAELQNLGAIPVADCRPDLTAALQPIDEGDLTEPLLVPGGVQIIRLVARIPAGYQSFEEVAEELRRRKSAESYENQTRGLVEKLRQDYLVEVHEEYLDLVFPRPGGA
jgi:parvulin-like peptidyl-prolyl isomerase